MKHFLYVILIMLVFIVGINIGSSEEKANATIIKDKIENFENNIIDNKEVEEDNIKPNILNKIADKCNDTMDGIVNKIMKIFSE